MFCSTTFDDVIFGGMFSPENRFDISSCKGGKPTIGSTILGGIMLVLTLIFWELNIIGNGLVGHVTFRIKLGSTL
jgi:hypothetical protein